MTVVISGDRIITLGKSKKVRIPANAQVVDAEGKYMIPGLWNMHVHIFSYDKDPSGQPAHEYRFPLFIANGITSMRFMWVRLNPVKQVEGWRKQAIEQPGSVPRIQAIGTIVNGPPASPNSDVVTTADEARQMVDKIKAGELIS